MIPWVPLMQADEPPEVVLQRCREVIDQHAPAEEHEGLLTVTQVFTRLRYKDPNLLSILGRKTVMIESPVIREIVGEHCRKTSWGHCNPLRPRAARTGKRGEIDSRRVSPGRRDQIGGVQPAPGALRGGATGDPPAPEPWDPADEPEPKP